MTILSNLTKQCVLCKFSLRIGRIVNKKLQIGVWISFFCYKIQNMKFKILNGRTVHGPILHIFNQAAEADAGEGLRGLQPPL